MIVPINPIVTRLAAEQMFKWGFSPLETVVLLIVVPIVVGLIAAEIIIFRIYRK